MRDVDALAFFARSGRFRCRDFALEAGISRQAAMKHLRRAVLSGHLMIDGTGRSTTYAVPQDSGIGMDRTTSWQRLARECPKVFYARMSDAIGVRGTRRSQVHRLLEGRSASFVILDFQGVSYLSASFARALVHWWRSRASEVMPINATPAIDAAMRAFDLTPISGWCE